MLGFKKKKDGQRAVARGGRKKTQGSRRHAGPYSPEQRRQAVEAYFKSGMTQEDFAKTWGTSSGSLFNWVKIYKERGPKGLENDLYLKGGKKRGRKGLAAPVKSKILAAKEQDLKLGTKGVRDFLYRFGGLRVSKGAIRKTLREANHGPVKPAHKKRRAKKKPKIQRFERALPMQLWQTDITSLMLARHSQRVYLTVFMDDHSRYIVSWSLALQQTKEFVMEALLAGISKFGKPEEVLTDQGRQYFSWRGKSDFRKLLKKQGIRHVVSRAHHPETVGKCERFWETVQTEFWDRVEPQDLTDARERLGQFIANYNHFRPHQGLDGMTPADRFFGAEAEVRKIIEDTISKNALRIALGEAPRSPVFLIGQIGDTPVSLHGEKGKLVLQTSEGQTKRLDYEDFGHAAKPEPTAAQPQGEKGNDQGSLEVGIQPGIAEREGGGLQAAAQAAQEREVLAPDSAGGPGQSALGDGHARAAEAGARDVGHDHGVLAGQDHQAGNGKPPQDAATPHVAAVPAGDFGYGSGVTHPTQDASTAGSQEHGPRDAKEAGERSAGVEKEDREARENGGDAGTPDLRSSRDAGLQRCQNPHGDPTDGVSGGGSSGCSDSHKDSNDQENDGSGTDRSSS